MNDLTMDSLKSVLKNGKLRNTGKKKHYISDCPFCKKDGHFYFNVETSKWDCKKCGESGSLYKLLARIGRLDLYQSQRTIEVKKELTPLKNQCYEEDKETQEELPKVQLPACCKLGGNEKYLKERKITYKDVQRYKFSYTTAISKFKNYTIIPVFDGGTIKGYLGRYANKIVPENKMRYMNSRGTKFSSLLYGYDDITDKTETVILVEGVFDKIKLDKCLDLYSDERIKAVATFGKKISNEQINKLLKKGIRSVILIYDSDAINDMKRIGFVLDEYFETYITYTQNKDVDNCTDEEVYEIFNRLQRPFQFNIGTAIKLS